METMPLPAGAPANRDALKKMRAGFLFSGLSEEEYEKAERLADPFLYRYGEGEKIAEAGTGFPYLGLLLSGSARVSRAGESRPVILNLLCPGDYFGVAALFGKEEGFPTTVTACGISDVLLLRQENVERLLSEIPGAARAYIGFLSDRIRFLNRRIDSFAGRTTEEKVAAFLLRTEKTGASLPVSRRALASVLGLGRASLYRALGDMEDRGLIRVSRSRIEILDAENLKNLIH